MNIESKDRHDLERDLKSFEDMQKNGDKSQEIVNAISAIKAEQERRGEEEHALAHAHKETVETRENGG